MELSLCKVIFSCLFSGIVIRRCLTIHEIEDFGRTAMRHFSSTKGFLFAEGMAKHIDSSYLTTGTSSTIDGVKLVNVEQLREGSLREFDLIIITREYVFPQLFEVLPEIVELMMDEDRKTIIAHKGDSFGWIKNNDFRRSFSEKTGGKTAFREIGKMFDIICAQTDLLAKTSMGSLSQEVRELIEDKIFISRMGVPERLPYSGRDKDNIQIFDDKEKFCVDYWFDLKEGFALNPVCFSEKHITRTKEDHEKFLSKKIKIIYSGRIKIDDGNVLYLMRDIMLLLGSDFELHIFPGSFILPNIPISRFSSKFPVNIQLIRDRHFAECSNVIVHYPFGAKDKDEVMASMDIGLDFSQARPADEVSSMGNAKLLEYCYYGLKTVTEKNVYNSSISTSSGGGMAISGIGSAEEYSKAIEKLAKMKSDWRVISAQTFKNNGWDGICSEFLTSANKKFSQLQKQK